MFKPCATEHAGGGECPECGVEHDRVESLPDRPLSHEEMREIAQGEGIQLVTPGFQIHLEDAEGQFMKSAPVVVIAREASVDVLGLVDDGWVVENRVDAPDEPVRVAQEMRDEIANMAERLAAVGGMPTIR